MLILERGIGQDIIIGGGITVKILDARRGRARIGITAPKEVSVDRSEIHLRKQAEKAGKKDAP